MKIGYCTNMLSVHEDGTGVEWIPVIASSGYDYVELPLRELDKCGVDFIKRVKQTLDENDIPCLSANNFLPSSVRITGEKVNRSHIGSYLERMNSYIEILGIKTVVVGSACARDIPEGFPEEKALEQLVEFFCLLSETLPEGVVGVVEPICKQESNIINLVSEGYSIVQKVGKRNIRLLADSFHMENEREPFGILGEVKDQLHHIHVSPIEPRCLPFKKDGMQMTYIGELIKCRYDGCISVEANSKNPSLELPEARRVLNKWLNGQ